MKRYNILIISTLCIIIYIMINSGGGNLPVEKIVIPSGLGCDIIGKSPEVEYLVSASEYTFNKKNEIDSIIIKGIGSNIPETRDTRQTVSNKKSMYGLQKVMVIGDELADYGINPLVDILFSNQDMNDTSWIVVSTGKAVDMLQYKVGDFPSSADFISGMIDSAREQNFMSQNYKLLDMYVRVNSEGRNLVLPNIGIIKDHIAMTGMAVFRKDKMVVKVPIEEARYMNFLRENKVRGLLTLQKDTDHWASTYGTVKRKVRCEKADDKYKFNIDLDFKGKVINNTLYEDLMDKDKILKQYTAELEEDTKKKCKEFINKMQTEYKTDCLELGRNAAATFGRNSDIDWDEVVCNSQIQVNVKVKIDNFGRGDYK